jgi:hypothetical protein
MSGEKQLPEVVPARPGVIRVEKTIHLQFAPRSLTGRVFAVALAVFIVILGFFFLATAIALAGILVAIGIGRVLWSARHRDPR